MQLTETKAEGLQRAYVGKAPAKEIEAKVDAKLEAVRPSAQLKGFRKGKVPHALLKQMFGKSMLGEAMQEIVDDALRSHLEESGHRPAGRPNVKIVNDDFKEGDDLDVEFSYEMLPEIPEVEFPSLSLERLVVETPEAEVDKALESLADNAKSFEDKEGAAEDGDQVVIDFVGRIDGEAFDNGAAEDFPLVLGSNQFIPGFEPQLVGVAAGETRDVTVSFPEEYGAKELAGKEAVFEVTAKAVKAPKPSPVDDEMAKKYGADDLEALKTRVRDRIGEEYRAAGRTLLKRRLLDKLNDAVSFDLPPSMVEQEAKQIAHQLWHEANPDVHGHDHEAVEPNEEHVALAERRVKLGLLLADIGARNGIEVTESEVNTAIAQQARQYPGREREFFDYVRGNDMLRQQISAPIYEDKVVDYVIELASVSDKTVTAEELTEEMKQLDEDDS